MSNEAKDKAKAVEAGLKAWRELADESSDNWANFCSECETCMCDCLAAKFGADFDPRQIMLQVQHGRLEKLLVKDSVLWQCFKCYHCAEQCPQDVKPVEVIAELKKVLADLLYQSPAGGPGPVATAGE